MNIFAIYTDTSQLVSLLVVCDLLDKHFACCNVLTGLDTITSRGRRYVNNRGNLIIFTQNHGFFENPFKKASRGDGRSRGRRKLVSQVLYHQYTVE